MVTAELAAGLPVLVALVLVALAAVSVAGQQVRAQDAAREAVRAAARGDDGTARRLAAAAVPAAGRVSIARSGDEVIATVTVVVHPLAGWLPAITISARAVAAAEPDATQGSAAVTAGGPNWGPSAVDPQAGVPP